MVAMLGSQQEQIRSEIAELKHILIEQVMRHVLCCDVDGGDVDNDEHGDDHGDDHGGGNGNS